MIFSVTGQREELLAIDERRRQIAAVAAQPPAPAVTALMSGAAMPAPGPAVAVKAAEPDVSKRRKGNGKDRKGRDMRAEETGPGLVGEGMASAAGDAGTIKASLDHSVAEGPGRHMATGPGEPPGGYGRGYLEAGHAAPSPQHQAPRENPMPQMRHYLPPGEPLVAAIPPEATARFTMGSPSYS